MLEHADPAVDREISRPVSHDIHHARGAFTDLFGPVGARDFAVRWWDGTLDTPPHDRATAFTLVIHSPDALRRMFLPPTELRLGEAFIRGDFDVEGNLERATALAAELRSRAARPRAFADIARHILALPPARDRAATLDRRLARQPFHRRHSLARDTRAVRSHYDVGNDFYALWLDRRLVYSCAYFETGTEDIDTAQEAKLELICRKLRLRPGERLLDIGCGWGGLVQYAAERYGVLALGITLSPAQASLARERIAAAGLGERCAVEVRDYRRLPDDAPFDKIVSVGMFEHVGRDQLPTYFGKVARLLEPGGLFLNHGIVDADQSGEHHRWTDRMFWRKGTFISRYVFPDGELVPLATAIACAEASGLETRDVESLREHYVLTLRAWVRRLEEAEPEAMRRVGSQAYRTWRLYMAASANAFASRALGLAQILLAKPDARGEVRIPRTRADLYRPRDAGS